MSDETVRAAGGVVWRPTPSGSCEVVLVHRPAYDDWSFPKGKLHSGETEADAAVREVEEETGLRCRLGRELATSSYRDARNRSKTVRYWLMTPIDGEMGPANEVDAVRWVPLEAAARLLSYDRDRLILERFAPPDPEDTAATESSRVDMPPLAQAKLAAPQLPSWCNDRDRR